MTLTDLLEHCAGLTAWWDLYKRNHSASEFAHEIGELPLEYRPRTRSIYSDLGFLLLGFVVAERGGRPLDAQFETLLGDTGLLFRPPPDRRAEIAPTEDDLTWRGRLLVGRSARRERRRAWRRRGTRRPVRVRAGRGRLCAARAGDVGLAPLDWARPGCCNDSCARASAPQLARARVGHDAADLVVRHAPVPRRRSGTRALRARRCGSTRCAICTWCC